MPDDARTAPPCGPVVGVAAGRECGLAEAPTAGTTALAPSRISTWPAATDVPAAGRGVERGADDRLEGGRIDDVDVLAADHAVALDRQRAERHVGAGQAAGGSSAPACGPYRRRSSGARRPASRPIRLSMCREPCTSLAPAGGRP